jgi:hypothetical protein
MRKILAHGARPLFCSPADAAFIAEPLTQESTDSTTDALRILG